MMSIRGVQGGGREYWERRRDATIMKHAGIQFEGQIVPDPGNRGVLVATSIELHHFFRRATLATLSTLGGSSLWLNSCFGELHSGKGCA